MSEQGLAAKVAMLEDQVNSLERQNEKMIDELVSVMKYLARLQKDVNQGNPFTDAADRLSKARRA